MSRHPDLSTRERVLAAVRSNPGISYREIAALVGVKSVSVVSYHVNQLKGLGLVTKGDRRTHRTLRIRHSDSQVTREKKSAAGRKGSILHKKVAGIDADTWARIEKIGKREDDRKQAHSMDVIMDFHVSGYRINSLKCERLG